jgi:hypothetical protein
MKYLGTVLPTRQALARADAHADLQQRKADAIGRGIPGCTRRVVQGEVRYYRTPTVYATVSPRRGFKVQWFKERADGTWPIAGE